MSVMESDSCAMVYRALRIMSLTQFHILEMFHSVPGSRPLGLISVALKTKLPAQASSCTFYSFCLYPFLLFAWVTLSIGNQLNFYCQKPLSSLCLWRHLLLVTSSDLQETSSSLLPSCVLDCTWPCLHPNHMHTDLPSFL